MQFGALTVPRLPIADHLDLVHWIEDAGFDLYTVGDSQTGYRELYTTLGILAWETDSIRLGPGVTNPITRHPQVTASAIATLDEIADGRAILGLGTGDSAVRAIGERPARLAHLAETVEFIRSLTRGETEQWEGTDLELRWLRREDMSRNVPLFVSAEGPKTLELAGRVADGVIVGGGITPPLVQDALDRIATGARAADRDPAAVETWLLTKLSIDASVERARDAIKQTLASSAHHGLKRTDLAETDIPSAYHERLEGVIAGYDPTRHAEPGDTHNARLVDEYDLGEFLGNRYAVTGPVETCRQQLAELAALDGLDGFLIPPLLVDEPYGLLRAVRDELMPAVG